MKLKKEGINMNAVEYINTFSHAGSKLTDLSRISGLLERLGNPQDGQKFVHIAGTNGKGSTLEYISEILIDAGYRVGQFTSPFIEVYNDRIRICGENIPNDRLEEICNRVKVAVNEECYSQFEITFSIALIYFLEEKCDVVCLETGVGGMLDATNVIKEPLLSVITSVSIDHTSVLGNTVAEIAAQKAGIIKRGCPLVLSPQNTKETIEIMRAKAREYESEFVMPVMNMCAVVESDILGSRFEYKGGKYEVEMCGRHQVCNAVTAIETVNVLREKGYKISDENVKNGLKSAKVKLRIELLSKSPAVIADGGHNASGIDSLIEIVKKIDKPIIGVVGMMKGKAVDYAANKLSEVLEIAVCADNYIENNMSASDLSQLFTCKTCAMEYKSALETALRLAEEREGVVLICGSLYLASAARAEYMRKYRKENQ